MVQNFYIGPQSIPIEPQSIPLDPNSFQMNPNPFQMDHKAMATWIRNPESLTPNFGFIITGGGVKYAPLRSITQIIEYSRLNWLSVIL